MSNPNILGHVLEFCSDRDETSKSCRLHLALKNTLGQTKSIWVEVSSDLEAFFSPEGDPSCR